MLPVFRLLAAFGVWLEVVFDWEAEGAWESLETLPAEDTTDVTFKSDADAVVTGTEITPLEAVITFAVVAELEVEADGMINN